MDEHTVSVIITVVLILALIAYAIFLFEAYKKQIFIFTPYTPPPLENGFQPLIAVTPLSAQEKADKKAAYTKPG